MDKTEKNSKYVVSRSTKPSFAWKPNPTSAFKRQPQFRQNELAIRTQTLNLLKEFKVLSIKKATLYTKKDKKRERSFYTKMKIEHMNKHMNQANLDQLHCNFPICKMSFLSIKLHFKN